jgi:hypothetical protein
LEGPIVSSRYEQFYTVALDLKKLLPRDQRDQIDAHLATVYAVISGVMQNDRSQVRLLEEPLHYFKQLKKLLESQNKGSAALSELGLMAANVQQLAFQVQQYPTAEQIASAVPLKQEVARQSSDVLQSLKNLCKQMERLLKDTDDLGHDKSLAKSISQTSETAQIFYLLTRLFPYQDDTLKGKAAAATRRMQSSVSSMVTMLPVQGQGAIDLRAESDNLAAHLQALLDFSTSTVAVAKKEAPPLEQAKQSVIMRLNAEAEVQKRRHALQEAEGEVERLNSVK